MASHLDHRYCERRNAARALSTLPDGLSLKELVCATRIESTGEQLTYWDVLEIVGEEGEAADLCRRLERKICTAVRTFQKKVVEEPKYLERVRHRHQAHKRTTDAPVNIQSHVEAMICCYLDAECYADALKPIDDCISLHHVKPNTARQILEALIDNLAWMHESYGKAPPICLEVAIRGTKLMPRIHSAMLRLQGTPDINGNKSCWLGILKILRYTMMGPWLLRKIVGGVTGCMQCSQTSILEQLYFGCVRNDTSAKLYEKVQTQLRYESQKVVKLQLGEPLESAASKDLAKSSNPEALTSGPAKVPLQRNSQSAMCRSSLHIDVAKKARRSSGVLGVKGTDFDAPPLESAFHSGYSPTQQIRRARSHNSTMDSKSARIASMRNFDFSAAALKATTNFSPRVIMQAPHQFTPVPDSPIIAPLMVPSFYAAPNQLNVPGPTLRTARSQTADRSRGHTANIPGLDYKPQVQRALSTSSIRPLRSNSNIIQMPPCQMPPWTVTDDESSRLAALKYQVGFIQPSGPVSAPLTSVPAKRGELHRHHTLGTYQPAKQVIPRALADRSFFQPSSPGHLKRDKQGPFLRAISKARSLDPSFSEAKHRLRDSYATAYESLTKQEPDEGVNLDQVLQIRSSFGTSNSNASTACTLSDLTNSDHQSFEGLDLERLSESPEKYLRMGGRCGLGDLVSMLIDSNHELAAKLSSVKPMFPEFRRIAGDGNCFYRSFIFGLLEQMIVDMNRIAVGTLIRQLAKLHALIPQELLVGSADKGRDALVRILSLIDSFMGHGDKVYDVMHLARDFQNARKSDAIVQYMRCITAYEMLAMRGHFEPFLASLENDRPTHHATVFDMEESCNRHVLRMGMDAEHMCVLALASALKVAIAVLYTAGGHDCKVHPIDPAKVGSPDSKVGAMSYTPGVFLLYRSGHYEIIYPTDNSWQALLTGSEFRF